MAMNGIDIASYQASLNLDNVSYDFVMVKATEGVDYVNPYCDTHYQEAKAQGKKRATYHFTNFGDPIAEADYFADNTVGYIRDSIPVLDWEGSHVDRVQDALAWLRHVRDRYGYNPAIYMSEWVENHYDWSPVVNEDFGLIIAKYSDYEIDNNYDMSGAGQPPNVTHWDFYFMWQWTSKGHLNGYAGDLDCDIAYLTPDQWDKYAGVQAPTPSPTPAPQPVITTSELTEKAAFPYSSTTRNNDRLPKGTLKLVQKGRTGEITTVYTLTYTDGAETNRVIKNKEITIQPVDEITEVGTYESPAPSKDDYVTQILNKLVSWLINVLKKLGRK